MNAVTVDKITKSYGNVQALKGVSFTVEEGEIFGIIGPDGAGKTSLFRILTTLLLPDDGNATVEGLDVVKDYKAIRNIVGYMPGRFSLYQDLTVEENLNFFATLFKVSVKDNYDLVKEIYSQIEPFKDRRAGALSGGMKQKLALSCALIHKPKVLYLDEPTTGVDPVSRKQLWDMLLRLKEQAITILVSTPYMDEAKLCDRVSLIRDGQFMITSTPDDIVRSYDDILWAVSADDMPGLLKDLRAHPNVTSSYAFGDTHHITVKPTLSIDELKQYLIGKGHASVMAKQIEPTVEDCYLKLSTSPQPPPKEGELSKIINQTPPSRRKRLPLPRRGSGGGEYGN